MQQATAEEITLADRIKSDPVWFVTECLGDKPWKRQREILEAVRDNPRVAVRSCHGVGKSWVASRVALWFLFAHPGSIVVTTAPTDRQVRAVIWAELRRAYNRARIPLGGNLLPAEPRIQIDDKWFAFGFTAKDANAFQGLHSESVLALLDEASGIKPDIWTGAEAILSSDHCRLVTIGNPTDPTGNFAAEFKAPGKGKLSISAFGSPNFTEFGITLEDIRSGTWEAKITGPLPFPELVTPAWVADKLKRWGETSPLWVARVMGQFPEQGTDTLLPLSWIEAAQTRELEPAEPNELGADIARFGDDRTVIMHRRGGRARVTVSSTREDTMQTTGRIVHALQETSASCAKVDDIGLGGGVTDRLRELGKPVVPINVGEGPNDPSFSGDAERFLNKRAELWWGIRERFQDGAVDIDPTDDDLAAELAAIKYKFTSNGKIQIEKKADMKLRIGRSPDRADALMLAFASPADSYDLDTLNS